MEREDRGAERETHNPEVEKFAPKFAFVLATSRARLLPRLRHQNVCIFMLTI
jgi:hypothetical protein